MKGFRFDCSSVQSLRKFLRPILLVSYRHEQAGWLPVQRTGCYWQGSLYMCRTPQAVDRAVVDYAQNAALFNNAVKLSLLETRIVY